MRESIRRYFRDIYLRIAGSLSSPENGIHILNSHYTSRHNPSYEIYCEFLQFLKHYCDFVTIKEALEYINRRASVNHCLVSFTYDDGFEECYSLIAPALEEFGTRGTFFVNGGFINGDEVFKKYFIRNIHHTEDKEPMSWLQIKNLHERGHTVGSHSLDHINFNTTDHNLVDFQLRKNKQLIEEYINEPCDFFAFPFGEYRHINNETLRLSEGYHKYIFSGTGYRDYFSFGGRVINRRHIESEWPKSHIKYFISTKKRFH